MMSRRIQHVATTLLALLALTACDPPKPTASEPTTWSWRDDSVGVALRLDSSWEQLDPRVIHAQAVFAARSESDRFSLHLLVVDLPGGDALEHDLGQLKAQSVEQLEQSVGAFELERQGPITLDAIPGQSVFALGDVSGVRYSYILAYAIASGRLYQLVATSRAEDVTRLATLVDGVLVTWDFLDGT